MLTCLETNTFFTDTTAYWNVPHRVHFLRARGLMAAGRVEEALKEIQICLTILPADIETPILLVPALEKVGRKQDAAELFNKVFTNIEQYCADFPRWAEAHNMLAWLSARCRRQLDAALTHAQTAAKLVPQSASYLDTLAEVHFQRGDQSRAIALMRRCIVLDPKADYFRQQLNRFETGDILVDVAPRKAS